MCVGVAFVQNECTVAINVQVGSNEAVTLAGGKICIVPAGVKVTADVKTKNETVKFTNKNNGSGASISLSQDYYWSCTVYPDNSNSCRVRLVRSQQ
jgi:hypothetical protein